MRRNASLSGLPAASLDCRSAWMSCRMLMAKVIVNTDEARTAMETWMINQGLCRAGTRWATMGFPTPVALLVPALQSPWLIIHVSIAVLASSLFTITFAMSILQLIQADRQSKLAAGKPDKLAFLRMVPSAAALENFAYRINAVGFVMWTFTLMAGAVWAEAAWGRYWGWDTKEVWTFVIWVVFAGYLHARATR